MFLEQRPIIVINATGPVKSYMTSLHALADKIKELKTQYDLNTFVETGCWKGDGVLTTLFLDFEQIYTCDIQKTCADAVCTRFINFSERITVSHEESVPFLEKTFNKLKSKSCFVWLDAHFPELHGGEPTSSGFPLLEELDIIRKFIDVRSVILIDDIRVLADSPRMDFDQKFKMTTVKLSDILDKMRKTHFFCDAFNNMWEGLVLLLPLSKDSANRTDLHSIKVC